MLVLLGVALVACGSDDRPTSIDNRQALSTTTTAALGPDGCGLEVLDCDPAPPPREQATCTTTSFVDAARAEDGAHYQGDPRCDGQFAIITIALGDCLPESNAEQRTHCERYKRAYFTNQENVWTIVTYGSIGYTCADVEAATGVEFPPELCE